MSRHPLGGADAGAADRAGKEEGGTLIAIRPATRDDLAFLLALAPRLAQLDLPAWRTAHEVAHAEARALVAAVESPADDAAVLIAEDDAGTQLGVAYLETRVDYFSGAAHAHLAILAVSEEAEGRGVARRLLAAGEDWARSRGLASITLNVFDLNLRARRVYEQAGYGVETVRYVKVL